MIDVVCATCHRHERWTPSPGGRPVIEVVSPGGRRRPAEAPQWARGRTALRAFAGETGPVVDVCSGCGQLLVAQGGALPAIEVRIDTPKGALVVGREIVGPAGKLTREEAEAWLEAQYKVSMTEGWLGDLGRLSMFIVIVPPFLLWLGGMMFVAVFLAAIYEGAPDAVQGTPGFDMMRQPAPGPTEPAAPSPTPQKVED
jgi:hypothetical protein